jgi:putative ABC transport system ATP-binding protein
MLSGINPVTHGQLTILGHPLHAMSRGQRDQFRADHLGYVFQQFNLIGYLSVLDNILLPLSYSRVRRQNAHAHSMPLPELAATYAQALGLSRNMLEQKANQLSHGQQQRVAFARSMMGHPSFILADEPTSSLDPANASRLMKLLLEECKTHGMTVMMVSHDPTLSRYFDQTLDMATLRKREDT